MKPYNVKRSDITAEWHVLDARDKTLGRICSEIAILLQGKHKPAYTPHLATGDFVVVVNANKFRVSGNKLAAKKYYRHSGYHGGLREETLAEVLAKDPTRALKQAVKGMLPKNKQGKHMLSRLKLYAGEEHPHQAQVNAPKGATTIAEKPKAAPKTEKPKAEPVAETAPAPEAVVESPGPAVDAVAETAAPDEHVEASDDLASLTVADLRELAQTRGVALPSKARKADIIEALESAQSD